MISPSSLRTLTALVSVVVAPLAISAGAAPVAKVSNKATQAKNAQLILAGPLSSSDLQQIQGVGHAVLSVRQGASLDLAQELMHQDVKSLGVELDKAIKTLINTPPQLRLGKRSGKIEGTVPKGVLSNQSPHFSLVIEPDGTQIQSDLPPLVASSPVATPPALPPDNVKKSTTDAFSTVRERLNTVRSRAVAVSQGGSRDSINDMHTAQLLTKTTEIQDEVRAALDINVVTPEDLIRLSDLRDRLQPKTLDAVIADQRSAAAGASEVPIAATAPSISTLFRHR